MSLLKGTVKVVQIILVRIGSGLDLLFGLVRHIGGVGGWLDWCEGGALLEMSPVSTVLKKSSSVCTLCDHTRKHPSEQKSIVAQSVQAVPLYHMPRLSAD